MDKIYKYFVLMLLLLAGSSFSDNFTDLHDDGLLDDWTIGSNNSWTENDGKSYPSSPGGGGILIKDVLTESNGVLQADIVTTNPKKASVGGLIFRYENSGVTHTYYFLTVHKNKDDATKTTIRFYKDDPAAPVSSMTVDYKLPKEFRLKIILDDDSFYVF
jgi:hypothetical protein